MSMLFFLRKLSRFIKALKHFYKFGGYTQVNVSQINYGNLFSTDTTVLITGGSQGIGLEICKRFLENGANVIITGRKQSKLDAVVSAINTPRLSAIEWNISDVTNISSNIQKLNGRKIDILVNNAGVYSRTHFPNCTSEDWDNVYDTNAKGTFFLCQEFCKIWKNDTSRSMHKIINIGSQGGFSLANNPYRMTKWDIRGFTKYLGSEVSKDGIIVNSIAPGVIMTNMQPEFRL